MGRIGQRFGALKNRGEKALVAYVTAGDPDLNATRQIVAALDRVGVDILELGVPFSDPTADGPIIQAASRRALEAGTSLKGILGLVSQIRKTSEVPIVLFGYFNPIFSYGASRFARDAASAGVDGLLVVDLPWEEAKELRQFTDAEGIETITLIAPTTGEERARKMVRNAAGFLYYVSMTGVTGTGGPSLKDARKDLSKLRGFSPIPVVIGFGIKTPSQAAELAPHADGIVVGSALVEIIHQCGNHGKVMEEVTSFVREMKRPLRTF